MKSDDINVGDTITDENVDNFMYCIGKTPNTITFMLYTLFSDLLDYREFKVSKRFFDNENFSTFSREEKTQKNKIIKIIFESKRIRKLDNFERI